MRILAFGDSVTLGMWDYESGGWVNRIARALGATSRKNPEDDPTTIYNLGVSGNSSREILERFENEVKYRLREEQEIVIIIATGINDSWFINKEKRTNVSETDFRANLQKLADIAKKYSTKIFFVGINPVDESRVNPISWRPELSYKNELVGKYDAIIREIGEKNHVDFIDIMSEFKKRDYVLLLEDGAHPNSTGHKVIFEIIHKHLSDRKII